MFSAMAPDDSNLTEVQQVSGGESDEVVGPGPSVGPSVGPGPGVEVVEGEGGSGDNPLP